MKYIVIEDNGLEKIILFSMLLEHSRVAGDRNVVSAGFVLFRTCEYEGMIEPSVKCHGKSISLGIESRPEIDTKLLEREMKLKEFKYY